MNGKGSADEPQAVRSGQEDASSPRELMLTAGIELLEEHGLSFTMESLSYATVFDYLWEEYEVRVTRASVHERIWASREDFRREVLDEVVGYFPLHLLGDALLESMAASEDAEGFPRAFGARTVTDLIESQISGVVQSVKALSLRIDDVSATDRLQQLLDKRTEIAMGEIRNELPQILASKGLTLKPELGLSPGEASDLLCVLIAAVSEGGKLNYHAGVQDLTAPIEFMSIPADVDQPWRILSLAIKGFLDFLYQTGPGISTTVEVPELQRQRFPEVEPDADGPSSTRRPRSELKRLVLTAAAELLLDGMLDLQPEMLNYSSVFAHIKETRGITLHTASIHRRIWDTNNDYRLDVLTKSLDMSAKPMLSALDLSEMAQPVLDENGVLDRDRTVYEVIRQAGEALTNVGATSTQYRRILQMKAALATQEESEAKSVLSEAIASTERRRMERNYADFKALALDLGYEVRPEVGLSEGQAGELFEILTMTTGAGTTFRALAGISAAKRRFSLPTAGDPTERRDWTPAGIAMLTYFNMLYRRID